MNRLLMISITLTIIPFYSYSQEIPTLAIFIGQTDFTGSPQITYTMQSQDLLWTCDKWEFSTPRYPLTNDPDLLESSVTLGGNSSCSNFTGWPGWYLILQDDDPPVVGYGLYKVTNTGIQDVYFFLNTRDCDWGSGGGSGGYNPDFWIRLQPGGFSYNSEPQNCTSGWTNIEIGETINVWDIENGGIPPDTDCFETWRSYLRIANAINHPKLVWSPNPDEPSNYKIYRAVTFEPSPPPNKGNYSLLATVSSSVLSYIDYDFTLGGTSHKAYYFVEAILSSTPYPRTVSVNTYVLPYKRMISEKELLTSEYNLYQNFPNPFNSNTIIKYFIPAESYVEIKIYNIFGEEIEVFAKESQPAGLNSVEFNAKNLASGIYYYRISANSFTETRKMILMR